MTSILLFLYGIVIREWAILALRHLCDNNPENQQVIADLRAQGVVETPVELSQLGLKLELNENGKFKVTKVEM